MESIIQSDNLTIEYIIELVGNYESLKFLEFMIGDRYTKKIKLYRYLLDEVITYVYQNNEQKFMNMFVDLKDYSRISQGKEYYIFSKEVDKVVEAGIKNEIVNIYFDIHRNGHALIKVASKILEQYDVNLEEVELKYYR